MNIAKMNGELTAKQQRQLEKQQRRKKYADLAIQGTNNSSIASKRSVELLYVPHLDINKNVDPSKPFNEYFKFFVKKSPKRSPCINRGYWLRLHAIRSRLDSIAEGTVGNVIVINLGCGFDPLPFQLLDKQNSESFKYHERFSFLDIDYPDLIAEKVKIIKNSDELTNILGPEETVISSSHAQYASRKYIAASCNLNHPDSFEQLLTTFDLRSSKTIKVFISEVSLAYMKPECADNIILSCSALMNVHFLMLEQIIPEGENEPFSRQMLKHFRKNSSPLQSVLEYHTIESQEKRFNKLGFPYVNAGDMSQLWQSVSSEMKSRIEAIEPFDELEEFQLFCHHYIICHAVNYPDFKFENSYKFTEPILTPPLEYASVQFEKVSPSIVRKFGSSVIGASHNASLLIYTGGSNPSRINETISIDSMNGEHEILKTMNAPPARMCHTCTILRHKRTFALIGGRKGPNEGLVDTWFFDIDFLQWKRGPDLPEPRYRHSSCILDDDKILVCGGKSNGKPFLLFDLSKQRFEECSAVNFEINVPLVSPATDYNIVSHVGVIVGGSIDGNVISNSLYVFTYLEGEITIVKKISNPLLQRYGAKVIFINEEEVLVAGGTSPEILFGDTTSIIIVNTKTDYIRSIKIPQNIWQEHPLSLVGFEIQRLPNSDLLITGGGATCYGFGSIWNQGFKIKA